MDVARRKIARAAWRLARDYWTSEERWSAWGLLAAVVALNLGNVYISVQINRWNSAFYNALQTFNRGELFRQLGIFGILVAFAVSMSVYALYLSQMLQIRWRRWLTRRYLAAWLANRAYYQLQLGGTTDNPDQRISEDLNQFTALVLSLSTGLITSVVSLVSFLVILWKLSGPLDIPFGAWGLIRVPAYLVWAALLYVGAGTWFALKIGRPLVPLNFARQRFLDEATSALDELSKIRLYELLRAASWMPAVVSVGHRSTLRKFHDRILEVTAFSPLRERQPPLFRGTFLGPPEVMAGPPLARSC